MHADPIVHAARHNTSKEQAMSEPVTIFATVPAWLGSTRNPADLIDAIERGDYSAAIQLVYLTASDMKNHGWTRVGEAEVKLTMMPRDEAVAQAGAVLQAKLEEERAESYRRQQQILAQISKLQALTYEAA